MIEPLSSQIPWMVSPGNHEIEHIFVNKTNAHGKNLFYKLFDLKEVMMIVNFSLIFSLKK